MSQVTAMFCERKRTHAETIAGVLLLYTIFKSDITLPIIIHFNCKKFLRISFFDFPKSLF